jgi:hypothetical protein
MPTKTTVYLDRTEYLQLKAIARREGRKTAAVIRTAVAEYARRHARKAKPRSVGIGRSGRNDLSERAERLLTGFGRSR